MATMKQLTTFIAVAEYKKIRICPIQDISMDRFFYICYNKNHPVTPQMQAFINEAKKCK